MASPIKFHPDEHIDSAIAAGLVAQGFDVSTTAGAGLAGAEDTDHFYFALSENRVIVTHDHDYLRLDAGGLDHAGIAYCRQDKYTIGQLLHMLILLHACYSAEELQGRVEYL